MSEINLQILDICGYIAENLEQIGKNIVRPTRNDFTVCQDAHSESAMSCELGQAASTKRETITI
jgi:hypothetical protein